MHMTKLTKIAAVALAAAYLAAPFTALAADKSAEKKADKKEAKVEGKAKAYPLDTCIVSDEKLDSMGEPYVFTHEGQQIKLCCKSCLKDFNKTPNKYLSKLKKAEKK
jgi:hypothetical protein